ncbi:MAG: DUF503 domain-containing protein [candidate division WOR-3 bacterium]
MAPHNQLHKFFVGICDIDLHIENCHSLKERRRVLLSLKEKIKNHLNVAVCEFGDSALWQRSQLAIVTCSNTKKVVESTLGEVLKFIEHFPSVIILNSESRII